MAVPGCVQVEIEMRFTFGRGNINRNVWVLQDVYDGLINAFNRAIGYLREAPRISFMTRMLARKQWGELYGYGCHRNDLMHLY
jgi:hypothetical protein